MRPIKVHSDIDPGELRINRRFRGSHTIHPRARKAKDALADEVQKCIELMDDSFVPCKECECLIAFTFTSNRFDIDGPLKRTLDAVQQGIKQAGYTWSDARVMHLHIDKIVGDDPGITLVLK